MKIFVAVVAIAFLAGCGHMGMHKSMHKSGGMGMHSGGGMHAPSSAAYGSGHAERDDEFHMWVN